MVWYLVMQLFSTVLDWLAINRLSEQDKVLEILVLRQQLSIAERKLDKPLHLTRVEKLTLAVMAVKLKTVSGHTIQQFQGIIRLVQPETVFKWHRELVRRKWTYANRKPRGGRPRTDNDRESLILQLARENPDWGYGKIQGEVGKLGYTMSQQTIAKILARHGIPPSPQRQPSVGWRHLMQHYKQQILACDFFTVETVFLNTVYVLFFIEVGSRRVHFAGCTAQPSSAWVTQQARQIVWSSEQYDPPLQFLIHDRDTKFSHAFNTVFESEGIEVILTPAQAPNANAFAERWVRTVREECLDKLILMNESHLRQVMNDYGAYYNTARPHQGLGQQIPIPLTVGHAQGKVSRRDILGGILHDYYRAA